MPRVHPTGKTKYKLQNKLGPVMALLSAGSQKTIDSELEPMVFHKKRGLCEMKWIYAKYRTAALNICRS